jgi:hypothetical protein
MPVKLNCVVCGTEFWVRPSRVKSGAKYCSYPCHQVGEGRKGGKTTGDRKRAESQHKSYPKLGGRHIHRIVAEKLLGRELVPGEIVHHKDEDKQNSLDTNLEVTTQGNHIRTHLPKMLEARRIKRGY